MPASSLSRMVRSAHVHPLVQHRLGLGERLQRLLDGAVVGQHHQLGAQLGEAAQAGGGLLEVEVRRWRGRAQHPEVGQLDADRVADEQGARSARRAPRGGAWRGPAKSTMVRKWPSPRSTLCPSAAATRRSAGTGSMRPYRPSSSGPYTRAALSMSRVGSSEVAGAPLVHHHGGVGERRGHVADAAGVVEMDVRDDDPAQVGGSEAGCGERIAHGADAGLRPGLHQRRLRPVDEEARRHAVHAAEEGVDLADARRDQLHAVSLYNPPRSGQGRRALSLYGRRGSGSG